MFKYATVVALFVAVVVGQDLIINTPGPATVCQPTLFTWSGGIPPYILDLLDGSNPNGGSINQLATDTTATSFTWKADMDPGRTVVAQIRDSTGLARTTGQITIQDSPDKSCLNGGSSSSSSGSSSSSSATGKASSSSAATTKSSSSTTAATNGTSSTTALGVSSPSIPVTSSTPAGTASSPSGTSTAPASNSASNSATSPSASPSGAALSHTAPVAGALAAIAVALLA